MVSIMYVLTLVSPVQQSDFDLPIHHALNDVNLDERDILESGKAVDWFINKPLSKANLDHIRVIYQIDIFQQKFSHRPKKLFMADMDATIVEAETLDILANKAGIGDKISAMTERAMRGELDFEQALIERVRMLSGIHTSIIQETLDEISVNKGADDLLHSLKKAGIYCVLISGGFTQFTGNIAKILGFDAHFGNELMIEKNYLTGQVAKPILDKEAKKNKLDELQDTMNLQTSDICAIGDGANDLPLLQAAGLGVGYRPKPLLIQNLDNIILYTDLSALCYVLKI